MSMNITKLTAKYNTLSNDIIMLTRQSTQLAHTVTNMRQMALQSMKISFIQRTLSRYNDNIKVNQQKAKSSIERGKTVKTEAVLMLKIVENFGVAAAEAKELARLMLTKVRCSFCQLDSILHAANTLYSQLFNLRETFSILKESSTSLLQ